MMHMRPFQIILVGFFAVLAIIGLYVFSTFTGFGDGTTPAGKVVIWGSLPADVLDETIAGLKSARKEYADVSYVQKRADTFDNELANALASGTGPDLIILNQEQLLTEVPKIENIPFSSISQRTYLDSYLSIDQIYLNDVGTYAIPLVVDPIVLYYNRALLSSAGIATPPATWEAVAGLASVLTKQDGSNFISQSAIALGGYGNITNARAILSLLLLQAGSSITVLTEQDIHANLSIQSTTGAPLPAEAAVNFYTQFGNPAKSVYSWNPSLPPSRQAFLSGDLVFYIGYASEQKALAAANPNLDFDMAAIPQPGTGGIRKTYGLAYAFSIPKVAANKSGAYATALALSASDALPMIAKGLGMAPARRALLTSSASDPFTAVYYPEALNAMGWLSPAPATVDSIFSAMISNITTGRFDTPHALNAADQSLNAAI